MTISRTGTISIAAALAMSAQVAAAADDQPSDAPNLSSLAEEFVGAMRLDNHNPNCEQIQLAEGQSPRDIEPNWDTGQCQQFYRYGHKFFQAGDVSRLESLIVGELKSDPTMVPVISELTDWMKADELVLSVGNDTNCRDFVKENGTFVSVPAEDHIVVRVGAGYTGQPDGSIQICGAPLEQDLVREVATRFAAKFLWDARTIDERDPDNGYRGVYGDLYCRLDEAWGDNLPKWPEQSENPDYPSIDLGEFIYQPKP